MLIIMTALININPIKLSLIITIFSLVKSDLHPVKIQQWSRVEQ